eukprot:gene14534-19515_t
MPNFVNTILAREIKRSNPNHLVFPKSINININKEFNSLSDHINSLKVAIDERNWGKIEITIGDIILNLLDSSNNMNQLFSITPKKKQQREIFASLGGLQLLLKLFEYPFGSHDARLISETTFLEKSDVWNEVLVILREIAFTIPSSSEKIFDQHHIVLLFSYLCHHSVFDNTMNLLEEILACRDETFSLASVPNLFTLLNRFSARQLAHFCRVLSLVLFEPEDRQIMEGSHVLRSIELLQLRRNRMSKNSSGIVERNQSLIIEMPNMLSRLVQILRIINFGPDLADLISHNIVTHMPITSDIFQFASSGSSDWDHFAHLEEVVYDNEINVKADQSLRNWVSNTQTETIAAPVRNNIATSTPLRSASAREGGDLDDDIMAELLSAFSPNQPDSMGGNRMIDLSNLVNVMQVAQNLGVASMTPLGQALLGAQNPLSQMNNNRSRALSHDRATSFNRRSSRDNRDSTNPSRAKKQLQFHAMLLSPHQIELIFVLCTLLSGRRKISIQERFADLGLAEVLNKMYNRMSWNAPPFTGTNPMEHIHGPGCECNPESAVRVQYLRLIHNFYDRDFVGNSNKLLVLSQWERIKIMNSLPLEDGANATEINKIIEEKGLLSKIIVTLINEPPDSTYRFWLSACVENFLRGCGYVGQQYIAQTGILSHTTSHIVESFPSANNSLQTSFDLLGELIKCNKDVLELFESSLTDESFNTFFKIVLNNLVDSNVFIRALYLSFEVISFNKLTNLLDNNNINNNNNNNNNKNGYNNIVIISQHHLENEPMEKFGFFYNALNSSNGIKSSSTITNSNNMSVNKLGYLTDSWVQFTPSPISNKAIVLLHSMATHKSRNNKDGIYGMKNIKKVNHNKKPTNTIKSEIGSSPNRNNLDYNDETQSNTKSSSTGTTGTSNSTTSNSTFSSLSNGMMGAFKDIRKATTHFLKFSDNNNIISTNNFNNNNNNNNNNMNYDYNSSGKEHSEYDNVDDKESYYTPPEGPKYVKEIRENNSIIQINNNNVIMNNIMNFQSTLTSPATATAAATLTLQLDRMSVNNNNINNNINNNYSSGVSAIATTPPSKLLIPSSLSRISTFLINEKISIIFRLMSTVSLRTINHENICCLNTTLLILLLEHQR